MKRKKLIVRERIIHAAKIMEQIMLVPKVEEVDHGRAAALTHHHDAAADRPPPPPLRYEKKTLN